jgi:acyl-coenzyme A thioesterase PaaI-like protein
MKRIVLLLAMAAGFAAITSCGGGSSTQSEKATVVSVDSLINDASALVGQTVRFEATVDHSCMHGGKRLTVFGNIEGKTLKIDGTENSPNFVSSLKGKKVEVVGVVRKVSGAHVADCEIDEGNEVPDIAYVVDCIDYKEL